ncbi:MAG TPA: hypothetical protein PLP27_06550 [Crocinitomicaceae bacterium]|jgi:hypothetical protein|nr:hypothetical protein [Crocinitomicaceae bacterium]
MSEETFELVEKENVSSLVFPQEEVLKKVDEIKIRKHEINRAISLGNLEHHKVKIYFIDSVGKKYVDTTIWAVTEDAIVLKQNTIIPISRIIKVES